MHHLVALIVILSALALAVIGAYYSVPRRALPPNYPGAAIGVVILNGNKVLLGKRKGELGPGQYSVPGGKVDFGENPYDTVQREVKEETNLDLKNIRFTGAVTNDWFPDRQKHFICFYYVAQVVNPDDLRIMEPNKIEGWEWFDLQHIPQPTWMHTEQMLRSVLTGQIFHTDEIDGPWAQRAELF